MDKSQKLWVNELYLLKFTVCRLTTRVRKLENFVADSLDTVLSNMEDKIKALEIKVFAAEDHQNCDLHTVTVKKEENLSQINHETTVPSPFVSEDMHNACNVVKDSEVFSLAESLAEFEPIINDPEVMTYFSLDGAVDASVFEIMDYEAFMTNPYVAQQLLLAPLAPTPEQEVLQPNQSMRYISNSETMTTSSMNTIDTNLIMEAIALELGNQLLVQPPSPSHEVEISQSVDSAEETFSVNSPFALPAIVANNNETNVSRSSSVITQSPLTQAAPNSVVHLAANQINHLVLNSGNQIVNPVNQQQMVQSPVNPVAPSLVNHTVPSPMNQTVPSPMNQIVPSPVNQAVPSPVNQTVPSPMNQTVSSPVNQTVSIPVAPIPVNQMAQPHPVNQIVPNPVIQLAPVIGGSFIPSIKGLKSSGSVKVEKPPTLVKKGKPKTVKPLRIETTTVHTNVVKRSPPKNLEKKVTPTKTANMISTPTPVNEKPNSSVKKAGKNGKFSRSPGEAPGSFLCSECGKQFKMFAYLKRHARCHAEKTTHACTLCNKTYESVSRLNRHKIQKHPPDTALVNYCEYCRLYFANPFALTNHRLNIHPGE